MLCRVWTVCGRPEWRPAVWKLTNVQVRVGDSEKATVRVEVKKRGGGDGVMFILAIRWARFDSWWEMMWNSYLLPRLVVELNEILLTSFCRQGNRVSEVRVKSLPEPLISPTPCIMHKSRVHRAASTRKPGSVIIKALTCPDLLWSPMPTHIFLTLCSFP